MHRGIAASRHRGIAASRHRGIAASRHRGIEGLPCLSPSSSDFAFRLLACPAGTVTIVLLKWKWYLTESLPLNASVPLNPKRQPFASGAAISADVA
jgi:hypothetical protein